MSLNDAAERPAAPADRDPAANPPDDAERRAALAKLGALAAWTAPVMLTLVTSARADFGSPPHCDPGTCP